MIKKLRTALSSIGLLLAFSPISQGELTPHLVDISLSGNTSVDRWSNLYSSLRPSGFTQSLSGYGSYFTPPVYGGAMWPAAIITDPGYGDALLDKVSNGGGGGPYIASSSIYFAGASVTEDTYGGTIAITDTTPLANLETVTFQIEIGEVAGYTFFNNVAPKLSITTTDDTFTLANSFAAVITRYENGVSPDDGVTPVYINTWAYQWNLNDFTEITGSITSLSIQINGVEHSQIYSMQLNQSDAIHSVSVIPEPSTWCLLFLSAGVVILRARRNRGFIS